MFRKRRGGAKHFVASLSGGKDSLAMVLKLIEECYPLTDVVMFDTGMEYQSIYHNIEKITPIVEDYGATFTILKPDNNFYYDMLVRRVNKRNGTVEYGYDWCGRQCRWATTHKTRVINKWLKQFEDYIQYIGIAADESSRVKNENGKKYPLVEWGMTEKDCLEYCYSRGWNWIEKTKAVESGEIELYSILDRVSCWCCWNKNMKELRNIRKYLPEYWDGLLGLQSRIDRPYKDNATLFDLDAKFAAEERENV